MHVCIEPAPHPTDRTRCARAHDHDYHVAGTCPHTSDKSSTGARTQIRVALLHTLYAGPMRGGAGVRRSPRLQVAMYTLNSGPTRPACCPSASTTTRHAPSPTRSARSSGRRRRRRPRPWFGHRWASAPWAQPTPPARGAQEPPVAFKRGQRARCRRRTGMSRRAHLYSPAACCFWMGKKSLNSGGSSSSEYKRSLK